MSGVFVSSIEWTVKKLSSLIPSAASGPSSSATPSEDQLTPLEDLRRLERTMKRIQAALAEAQERDIRDHSEKYRLEELKEVAYDAEVVVGDYEYDVLHAKTEAREKMWGFDGSIHEQKQKHVSLKVIDLDSIEVSVPVSDEISGKVRAIRERFEEINRDWETLRLSESDAPRRKNIHSFARPPTSSFVQERMIYGRDEDRKKIIKQLLSEDNTSKGNTVRVASIVGMGGIGKTTLAQLVYNDERVCGQFELKGWICVSENFDVVVLTKKIIESLRGCEFDENSSFQCDLKKDEPRSHKRDPISDELDNIQRDLIKIVNGKRFFLVLDDVWNENASLWHSLHKPLTFAKSGIVLVTTRSTVVAKIMQTTPFYDLPILNWEACWSLFKQSVFYQKERDTDMDLINIGKQIVEKCCGLPLAVETMGSVLRYEDDIESWNDILKSDELGSNTRSGNLLPILKLSYYHMPSHLKSCFAFLALFPKDYYYVEAKIIELWKYAGLIHPSNGKKVEDIGRAYVKELQQRSMIIRPQTQLFGAQQGFVVHDLLHDLAQEIAKDEIMRWEQKDENCCHDDAKTETASKLTINFRYLSIVLNSHDEVTLERFIRSTNPRVLVAQVLQQKRIIPKPRVRIHNEVFKRIKYLRALDLSYTDTRYFVPSFGNLKQLRYLNLSKTGIEFLPDSICNFYNLETLELTGCHMFKLPDGIRKLSKLRHLNCKTDRGYTCRMPYGIGLLTNLQSLSLFVVGTNYPESDICELKNLLYLSDSLTIKSLENVTNMNCAKEAGLRKKQYLKDLTLNFGSAMINGRQFEEQLLESLEPHLNLERLRIHGYGGSKFPQWVGDVSFSKLAKVELVNCGSELLPPLGQLPSLKILTIEKAYRIRTLNLTSPNFPSVLEKLNIINCQNLEYVVDLRSLRFLRKLWRFQCPLLRLNAEEFPPFLQLY